MDASGVGRRFNSPAQLTGWADLTQLRLGVFDLSGQLGPPLHKGGYDMRLSSPVQLTGWAAGWAAAPAAGSASARVAR